MAKSDFITDEDVEREIARLNASKAVKLAQKEVATRLRTGDDHFKAIDDGNKVTQRAILALMKHAINGNDIDELRRAEKNLEEYLVEK